LNRTDSCSFLTANEQLPGEKLFSGFLLPTPERFAEAFGEGQSGSFQDLRAMSMTKNERIRAAIPHQGTRILSSHARFFLPWGNRLSKQNPRERTGNWRIRHGIARAIENLRGMRLSLVPRPDPRERLLQKL
jgi:hypothetical protein